MNATHFKVCDQACGLRLGDGSISRPIGRTKGGLNSQLHVVTDALGRPILMILTDGQVSDCTGAKTLLAWLPAWAKMLVADRGYDAAWIRKVLK